ncbi:MAG: RHS repeat-associated core domain-containing protein, partial [Lachnospiraceae bacterium]|nr:RHS repeat-associated core domain-containing protein [Lachnospiraceae bacterium]
YSGSTGDLLVSYDYDAWGKPTITDVVGTTESGNLIARNPYLYRGYRYDHETGLYYLQSRYYDPETGRFVNADEVMAGTNTSVEGYNLFSYCYNNPVNMIDSDGQLPKWLVDLIEDLKNFDLFNQSEEKALESHYSSIYKGAPVIRIEGDRSFSFGAIFFTKESNNRSNPEDVVRHEYGHTIQLKLMDPISYLVNIGLPSSLDLGSGEYYDKPWEITADILGGVKSRKHSKEKMIEGVVYLGGSALGPFGHMGMTMVKKECVK